VGGLTQPNSSPAEVQTEILATRKTVAAKMYLRLKPQAVNTRQHFA
jgi:hypothetical protein